MLDKSDKSLKSRQKENNTPHIKHQYIQSAVCFTHLKSYNNTTLKTYTEGNGRIKITVKHMGNTWDFK